MKFNLNKRQVFGGAIFNNVIIVISILTCCNVVQAENRDISKVINLFNNISWRITANNKIVDADESNWITEEKYSESIIKVIAQAVADCITDKNEFAGKNANDVIIFNVKAKTYSHENWNAVVLWNYLHMLKWNYLNNKTRSKDEIFEDVRTRICVYYPTEGVEKLDEKVEEAINDIKEYDKELSLADEMKKFNDVCKNTREETKDTIIHKHIDITPIGDWQPNDYKNLHDAYDKNNSETIDISQVEEMVLINYPFASFKGKFTPIKVKLENDLYFINKYMVWGNFSKNINNLYRIDEISKGETLYNKVSDFDEYLKYLVKDKNIKEQIFDKMSVLFGDLAEEFRYKNETNV